MGRSALTQVPTQYLAQVQRAYSCGHTAPHINNTVLTSMLLICAFMGAWLYMVGWALLPPRVTVDPVTVDPITTRAPRWVVELAEPWQAIVRLEPAAAATNKVAGGRKGEGE